MSGNILDPYEGKIKGSDYFEDVDDIPQVGKTKFLDIVVDQNDREKILDNVFERRKLKEGQRTDEDVSERLAVEIKEMKRKRFVEQKMRQQLRESNQELKELERKLRSAYVSKTLAAQLAEREALRAVEKAQLRREDELMDRAWGSLNEIEQKQAEKEFKKKQQLKRDLMEQMALHQEQKSKRYQDFLKEKEIIDEIIRKIYDEQLEEMREKMSKKTQLKKDMDDFMQLQNEWKERQRLEAEEESRQILEFLKKRDNTAEEARQEKQRQMKLKEDISSAIGQKIFSEEEERRKRMELLQDLQVEERKALEEQKLREDMERKLRERITTRMKLQEHREDVMKRKLEEQEEDRRYKEEQMRILAEKDKLDQLSDEKRRRKVLEHRKAIQECFEERKRRRAEEFTIMIKERDQDLQEEKRRQELIEEERIRMLKEHATALLGYFPPGVLKESDREHLPLPPKK